ncbi:LacI family DNA-binding transcriptional regulator [Actinosynnema sp. CA-248983]
MANSDTPRRGGMRQVAEAAGVSTATVSNVLNSPAIVAPETRRRVEDAMARVGFVRNGAARQLRGIPSSVVGAVLLDLANPFYGEVSRGVEDRVTEAGCMLMLCSNDAQAAKEARHLQVLEEHGVRGILVAPAAARLDALASLAKRGTPVVLLDHPQEDIDLCAVTVDNVLGGRLAAQHVIELGHRRLAFLHSSLGARQSVQRREGIHQALHGAGLDPATALVEVDIPPPDVAGGADAALDALFADPRPPTAVLCFNDIAALGVLRGLRRLGLAVPGEVSVVGYDDVQFAAELAPALTTIRQPKYELGRAAADLLLDETRPGHRHHEVLLRPILVVRGSTAAAPPP